VFGYSVEKGEAPPLCMSHPVETGGKVKEQSAIKQLQRM
jgi:hypothetical protein